MEDDTGRARRGSSTVWPAAGRPGSADGAEALRADDPAAASGDFRPAPGLENRRAFSVLVVDDDPGTQISLRGILEADGYAVDVAGTAAEVLSRDDWGRYGVILLDRRLPDGTAEELLPRLRERAPDAAIVVITGDSDVRSTIEAFRLGAVDYVLKPVDPDELRTRLGRIAGYRRQREELRHREQELRAVLDALPVGVWFTDATGRIAYGNPAAGAIWGGALQIGGDGIGAKTRWRPGTDQAIEFHDRPLARALRGEPSLDEVVEIERAGAERKVVLVSAVPLREGDGAVRGAVVINQDVTEQTHAEEALRESERRFRELLENVQLVAVMLDGHGRVLFCNDYLLRLTGWPAEAVRGQSWFDLFIPEERRAELFGIFFHPILRERVPAYHENEIATRTGERRLIAWNNTILRSSDGRLIGVTALGQDITERRRAEAALRESETRFRAMFESSLDAIAVLDDDARFIEVNGALADLRGTDRKTMQRLRLSQILGPGINFAAKWQQFLANGRDRGIVAMRRLDRTYRDVEYSATSNIRPGRHLFIFRDVTERKRADDALRRANEELEHALEELAVGEEEVREREARLGAILNTAADAIITFDPQGMIQTVNPAAEALFGFTEPEMVGRNIRMLMPLGQSGHHHGDLLRDLANGQSRTARIGREAVARRKDGTVFPVELAVSEITDLGHYTGIIRDVTGRKALEREVVEAASGEQRRIGEDLHDTVGQELTALNILAGDLTDALDTDPAAAAALGERLRHGLQRCQRQLRVVLRGLLPVPVDREGLMAALADLAERTRQDGGVDCVFDCPEPVAVADNLTATHLYLIAQESVHNAVKHARPQTISISLTADNGLLLRVADDGIGLEPPSEENRGLGLRIMRNRAAIIDARLTITPAAGAGTVVTCALTRTTND